MTNEHASSIKEAIQQAYAAADQIKTETTAVVEYYSNGQVLVIGAAVDIARFGDLPEPLSLQSLIIEDRARITGALGNFSVAPGNEKSPGLPAVTADIIVDLSQPPMLDIPVPPPGYYPVSINDDDLEALKDDIAELVGTFEKPRYFSYDASKCAHGRNGKAGCTRCLDACPTDAISSLSDKIEVDPYRCQGGGICATVCPSAAITYTYPRSLNLLQRLRQMILHFRNDQQTAPSVVFTSEPALPQAEQTYPESLVLAVEEVASVGLEAWMSALAWGANQVILFEPDELPGNVLEALQIQLETAQAILQSLYFPAASIRLLDEAETVAPETMPDITPASHAALADKRQALFMSIDYLADQAAQTDAETRLPEGAIFGKVAVDSQACTLCMSCVSACPGNALQDGRDVPQLGFIESKCLQCAVCVSTCPENAMQLSPRFITDKAARTERVVLKEEEPFCCISCGKPFATQSGLATVMEKLSSHPMFAGERAQSRLRMCDDCRVKDMMEDPDSDL